MPSKKLVCYICSKPITKRQKYADIDVIIKPSVKDALDGLSIVTKVHGDCIFDFYKRFLDICGAGEEKCKSEKKRKK